MAPPMFFFKIHKNSLDCTIFFAFLAKCIEASTFSKVGLERFKRIAGTAGEAILGYDGEILFVNTVAFNNVTANPKEFFKESIKWFAKRYGLREFAIDSPGQVNSHLVNHEIGHFIFGKYRSRGNTPDELALIKEEMVKTREIDRISYYAKEDKDPEELLLNASPCMQEIRPLCQKKC